MHIQYMHKETEFVLKLINKYKISQLKGFIFLENNFKLYK